MLNIVLSDGGFGRRTLPQAVHPLLTMLSAIPFPPPLIYASPVESGHTATQAIYPGVLRGVFSRRMAIFRRISDVQIGGAGDGVAVSGLADWRYTQFSPVGAIETVQASPDYPARAERSNAYLDASKCHSVGLLHW